MRRTTRSSRSAVKSKRAPTSPPKTATAVRAASDPRFAPSVVWYRLYTLTDLLSRPFWTQLAKPYEISQNEWRVLAALAYLPGTASHELSRVTGISPMNMSRAVAGLRKHGRIEEYPDPQNRVRKLIALTAKGLALYEELLPTVKKHSARMLASMSAEEVSTLTRLIEKVISRLEEMLSVI